MVRLIGKRIFWSLVIVLGVLSLTFIIIHLAPGDPASIYIRPEIDAKTVETIRRQMGLEKPLWQQYFLWLKEFVTGNFGVSFSHKRVVSSVIGEATRNTLQLTSIVFIFQLIVGVCLGVCAAVRQNTRTDHGINSLLLFFYSMPGFWLALMLISLFSLKLGWLPSGQMKSIILTGGFLPQFFDRVEHLILPVFILSLPFIAITTRFVRGSLLEILGQDYIRTARAYGLPRNKILFQYALKNALLPLVTLLGLYLPFLLGGSVIIENIFAWPGMGRITVNAIFSHDYPLILATNFIAALTIVIGNLISDILYFYVDPRIRMEGLS